MEIFDLFRSPQPELVQTKISDEVGNSLFRISFPRLLLQIPSIGESGSHDSFGLLLSDVEVAIGQSQCNDINSQNTDSDTTSCYRHVIEKHCGHGGRTWLKAFQLLGEGSSDSNTFYALRSKHILLGIGCPKHLAKNTQFEVIIPESSINWSLPVGLGGSSNAPPFDVFAMKDLSLTLMNGAYPLSSLYFKLYKLSPQNGSAQSDFSLAATRLHNSIGSYHGKMNNIIGQMNAEVDRLRKAVFSKENERVGALALGELSLF